MNLCKECNVETKNNDYCDLCAPHMEPTPNKENAMKVAKARLHAQSNELIEKLYGADAVLKPEYMCNDYRQVSKTIAPYTKSGLVPAKCLTMEDGKLVETTELIKASTIDSGDGPATSVSGIAHEATKYGSNISDVLTRTEIEDLSRTDAEYEQTPHDLLDHGASDAKKYTTAQIREFMSGKVEAPLTEEVEETLKDEVKKVFISKEQKQLNLDFFTNKVKEAKTPGQVGWIGFMVFNAIKGSERTFKVMGDIDVPMTEEQVLLAESTEEGRAYLKEVGAILVDQGEKEITVPTFFPKGESKAFWAFYNKVKAEKAAEVVKATDALELNYNKVLTIVNNATQTTNKDNVMDVISYEISQLDSQSLWDSLKYAKQSNRTFAYPVFKLILDNAKANKIA